MKSKSSFFRFTLILISILTNFNLSAYEEYEIGDMTYYLDDETRTATLAYLIPISTITNVVIPSSITKTYTINGITYSETYVVKNIGSHAFNWDGIVFHFNSITIPSTISYCGWRAFGTDSYSCYPGNVYISDLTAWCNCTFDGIYSNPATIGTLYLNGQLIEHLNIPYGITQISDFAFRRCDEIISLNIPNTVKEIGYMTFCGSGLKGELKIPESVTTIKPKAFMYCNGLETLYIPKSITSMGNGAFAFCTGLKDIYCSIEDPEDLYFDEREYDPEVWGYDDTEVSVFTCNGIWVAYDNPEVVFQNCVLHVPKGTVDKYRACDMFNHFIHIVEMDDVVSGDINGDNIVDVEDVNAAINITLKLNTIDDYNGSADVNGDGIVDVEDVNAIINTILKLD
ncbi:MAG: leucine-rich repeat protein [Muribaculaceae bacterium]|nr:leucine-rich repeat protein [Muribaculaceae bacterium]